MRQWANLGALVDGLHTSDFALIGRSLEDTIAEPKRAPLVPGLAVIKRAAADAGALGCSLSGSGPSLFALCATGEIAARVAEAMTSAVSRTSAASCRPTSPRSQTRARACCRHALRKHACRGGTRGVAADGDARGAGAGRRPLCAGVDRALAAGRAARLRNRTLTEIAYRALRPYTRGELDAAVCEAVVVNALNFPIPLVEVEPGIYALELFHGPTLAFKDVGARTMARLMASLDTGVQPLTVLAATSGDTGSAVAHAFHGVPHTRVVILYPDGRVSPTQEAQLTMFNSESGNVRAYAVVGQLRRLPSADPGGVRERRAPPAGAPDLGELGEHRPAAAADGLLLPRRRAGAAAARHDPRACWSARRAATSAISPPG